MAGCSNNKINIFVVTLTSCAAARREGAIGSGGPARLISLFFVEDIGPLPPDTAIFSAVEGSGGGGSSMYGN